MSLLSLPSRTTPASLLTSEIFRWEAPECTHVPKPELPLSTALCTKPCADCKRAPYPSGQITRKLPFLIAPQPLFTSSARHPNVGQKCIILWPSQISGDTCQGLPRIPSGVPTGCSPTAFRGGACLLFLQAPPTQWFSWSFTSPQFARTAALRVGSLDSWEPFRESTRSKWFSWKSLPFSPCWYLH